MVSETLNAHFDSIQSSVEKTPAHEALRNQALAKAAMFGIPLEVANTVLDAKLATVRGIYEEIQAESERTGGKLAVLRAQIDTERLAGHIRETAVNPEIAIAAIEARYKDDISAIIFETANDQMETSDRVTEAAIV